MSLDALVAEMDVAGVSHAVVHAEYEYGDPADDLNEAVAALIAKMPDRFSGYGTVSLAPLRVMRAAAQVTRSAQDRKSTRLNSSHGSISYAVFCLKTKK